jgi:serine/threonine protein kinase
MGNVFLARDVRNGQLLALKILPPRKAREEPRMLARFRREMDMNQRVNHEHIAWTYDASVVNGVHYIAMDFIPGQSLHRIVATAGPLAVPRAARLFAEICSALAHCHERGIIHRDLKPANIVVTPHDHAKLLDLGLALLTDETCTDREVIGGEGYIVGTMDYISPEQATNSALVTPLSDLYGLGCTMYYSLTGRVPFPGGTPKDKIQRHRTEWPEPVSRYNPQIPVEFAAVVGRTLMKDPAARHGSALELREELLKWCKGEKELPLDRPDDRLFKEAVAALDTGDLVAAETELLTVLPVEDESAVALSADLETNPFAELTAPTSAAGRRKSGVNVTSVPAPTPRPRSKTTDELILYVIVAGVLTLLLCGVSLTGLILLLLRR